MSASLLIQTCIDLYIEEQFCCQAYQFDWLCISISFYIYVCICCGHRSRHTYYILDDMVYESYTVYVCIYIHTTYMSIYKLINR